MRERKKEMEEDKEEKVWEEEEIDGEEKNEDIRKKYVRGAGKGKKIGRGGE